MEVGVLSGIARTQNADTDEGAEAQMSFNLSYNLFSARDQLFDQNNLYQPVCLTTEFLSVELPRFDICVSEVCCALGNVLSAPLLCTIETKNPALLQILE